MNMMMPNSTSNIVPVAHIPRASVLASRVRQIVQAEQARENFAETCIRVASKNGKVQLPRTGQFYSTDQESVCFTGTDDTLFKVFIEGTLPKLHKALLQDDGKPCMPVPQVQRDGLPAAYKLTTLGRQIVRGCAQFRPEWSVAYTSHAFHPAVTVMLRAMKRYAIHIDQEVADKGDQTPALAQLLERLTRFVRRASGTWRFINALREQDRQAQANFDSGRQFIYHLAARHSRLLILRIDLYYRPYYDAEKANKAINGFLRWIRGKACKRNLLPGYLGFIIKRENGLVRGMHWHLLVICDGNLQRNGGYLTQQLGEVWERRTGQGLGHYHNCWADRAKYVHDGLGVLELDDWEKMVGLRKALHYLTKQDCVLKATNDKVKNFWRSPISKKYGGKRGRPRFQDDSVRMLSRMLGGSRSEYPSGLEPGLPAPRGASVLAA